jgi:hypothetical protein
MGGVPFSVSMALTIHCDYYIGGFAAFYFLIGP